MTYCINRTSTCPIIRSLDESSDDDISSFVSSLGICLTTLGGMVLITRDSKMGGDSFDTAFLSAFLVAVMVGTIAFEAIMTLLSTRPGARLRARCCSTRGAGEETQNRKAKHSKKKKSGAVRVTPAAGAVPYGAEDAKLKAWAT